MLKPIINTYIATTKMGKSTIDAKVITVTLPSNVTDVDTLLLRATANYIDKLQKKADAAGEQSPGSIHSISITEQQLMFEDEPLQDCKTVTVILTAYNL